MVVGINIILDDDYRSSSLGFGPRLLVRYERSFGHDD